MERPAAEERMAVLETRLLPGSESMIEAALVLGSSVGRFDEARVEVRVAGRAARGTIVGRRRAAPVVASMCGQRIDHRHRLPTGIQLSSSAQCRCNELTESSSRQAGSHCDNRIRRRGGLPDVAELQQVRIEVLTERVGPGLCRGPSSKVKVTCSQARECQSSSSLASFCPKFQSPGSAKTIFSLLRGPD